MGNPAALWCFGHVHEGRGGTLVDLPDEAKRLGLGVDVPTKNNTVTSDFSATQTLCVNASNANNGRASFWPAGRPPMLIRLNLR